MIPIKKTALALGLLTLSAGVASAMPAVVETDLNLRAGPGTVHSVIAVMPGGAAVDARNCGGGWCRVEYGGRIGYASANYLDIGRATYVRPGYRARARVYARPAYQAYAYAPEYSYRDRPVWPNPLAFPLFPWNW